MEQVIINEMEKLGFSTKIGDIFLEWEKVKDELLESDKKSGTGNGTIHVFLGKEGYQLFKNLYPDYFNHVKATNETTTNAPIIKHFFSKANLISSIGHVCNYYVRKNETERVLDLVSKVVTKLNESPDKFFTSESLFKWSTGSNDLRPYFKQFDEGFQKTIRTLLLPNSAYKISLFQNDKNECAAFWLIGFDSLANFEMVASVSELQGDSENCVIRERKLTNFIFKSLEYFEGIDNLNSIVPFAEKVSVNEPIKVFQDGVFSLVGMFLEADIDEIKRRNGHQPRWFEKSFSLGNRTVYLSTQWSSSGKYQLVLTDFEKLVQTSYGVKYYYKSGKNGEHELWLRGSSKCTTSNDSSFPLQQIFYGAPGTGKSNTIKKDVEDQGRIHFRTTFHPDSDYSTFVGCYKPTIVEAPVRDGSGHEVTDAKQTEKKRISYSFVPQAFTKAYCEAWNKFDGSNSAEPVFLIIEEINRGNCAQIFGDIFQLLDREVEGDRCGFSTYPIDADEDLKDFLEVGTTKDGTQWLTNKEGIKDGKLCLPPNFYIWATMNTSDQSLFPIDSAFKRRWNWKYMPIDTKKENWTIKIDDKDYSWSLFLEKINEEIDSTTHSEDKMLGFYFCRANNNVIDADKFVSKVLFYLYNDVFKDYGLDRELFKGDDGKTISFRSYYKIDGHIDTDKVKKFLDNLKVNEKGNNPATADAVQIEDNV